VAADSITQAELEEQHSLESVEALALDSRQLGEVSLRERAARGTIINTIFRIGLAGVLLLQRLAIAAFLTPAELGVWGALLVTIVSLFFLKNTSISDKYIQQSEGDQEVAFQKAVTFELIVTGGFLVAAAALLPVFAIAYDNWSILLPGLVLLLAGVGNALQAPVWIFYRQMDFLRQRKIDAFDPLVTFIVTIALAAAGMGYWSLVIGAVTGSWSGAAVALRASPYRLKFRFERTSVREYFNFSWPLFIAGSGALVVAMGSVLAASHTVGIAGVGAISLAVSISSFAAGVDAIVTETLYPAICAVQDRIKLLEEAFVKSNRLALMWGVPFGLALALFASDLVHHVLGDEWDSAIILLQVFGVMVAINQLGFNWAAFLRARNQTRPIAAVAVITAVAFLAIPVPLLIADGLRGYGIGMLALTIIGVVARSYYLAKLFSGFQMLWHAGRAFAPAVPGVAIVLGMRLLETGARGPGIALAELLAYILITIGATALFERPLIGEMLSYLRRKQGVPAPTESPAH
jgi:O-antigen/teichoic acid export membrane protein